MRTVPPSIDRHLAALAALKRPARPRVAETPSIDRHLAALAARGYSPATVENRRGLLAGFAAWWEARSRRPFDPRRVSRQDVAAWHAALADPRRLPRPLAPVSVLGRLVAAKSLFDSLVRAGDLLVSPFDGYRLPRAPRRLRPDKVLTVEEVDRLLGAPDTSTAAGLRDRALLELLYSTGLRRAEAAGLDLADLDLHERVLAVRRGKGGKERLVPVGRVAAAWLREYVARARPALCGEAVTSALFVVAGGRRVTGRTVQYVVGRWARAAGLRPVSPHCLRHSCATHLLRGGAPLPYVSRLLGHASVEMTEVYLHLCPDDLKAAHRRAHPREPTSRHFEELRGTSRSHRPRSRADRDANRFAE